MVAEEFKPDPIILRDRLAITRTALANERTLLAYLRTAVVLLISAITAIQLFKQEWLLTLAWISLPVSVAIAGLGYWRFQRVRRQILVSNAALPRME